MRKQIMNRSHESQKQSPSGFTIIELMVVIAIIGIIMILALPRFGLMQREARMRAGAQQVAQDFRQIRERALSRGTVCQVTFDIVGKREYTVTHRDINDSLRTATYRLGSVAGGNLVFGTSGAISVYPPEGSGSPPGDGIDFDGNLLEFDNRGGADKGVVYITDNRDNYAVGVNRFGKIKVYKYGKDNLWH